MTPEEYKTAAAEFVRYPKKVEREYLRLKLIEEIGELAACFAKPLGKGCDIHVESVHNEVGDILWVASQLLPEMPKEWPTGGRFNDFAYHCAELSEEVWSVFANSPRGLRIWFHHLATIIEQCGLTLEDCAYGNIQKLTARRDGTASRTLMEDLPLPQKNLEEGFERTEGPPIYLIPEDIKAGSYLQLLIIKETE